MHRELGTFPMFVRADGRLMDVERYQELVAMAFSARRHVRGARRETAVAVTDRGWRGSGVWRSRRSLPLLRGTESRQNGGALQRGDNR